MSERRPPSPPRPYRDDDRGSSYRERDDRRGGGPSRDARRRSPSPGYARSSRFEESRDWRRDDRDARRDDWYISRRERDDYRPRDRDRDRDYRQPPPPPRARPSAYEDHDAPPPPPPSSSSSRRLEERPAPPSRRSRSPPLPPPPHANKDDALEDGEQAEPGGDADQDEDEDADAMAAMMGFGGFGTTKGKKVAGNAAGAAEIKKERTWRQYMNRKGGFNRPLDKIK